MPLILITDPNAKVKFMAAALNKFKKVTNAITENIKHEMDITPRDTSKNYWVNINGTWQIHNPSFPNEYPAVMSGDLKDAVSSDAIMKTGVATLRFGVLPGTSDMDGIGYAYFLEMGTEIAAPRPWITYARHYAKRIL